MCLRIAIISVLLGLSWAGTAAQTRAPEASPDEAAAALARSVRVFVELTPDSLTVGDPVTARFTVRADAGTQVSFAPELELGSAVQILEFREQPPRDMQDGGERVWEADYALAIYTVGERMLPPFRAQVRRGAQTAIVQTDSVLVYVASVLNDSLAAADLVDIKEQRDLAVPWPLWAWILLGTLALALLLFVLWWRRRHRRPVQVVVEPPKPAHELALLALRKLETKRLPLEGRTKEHYIELSEILRAYLEESPVFGIPALEETTDEIVVSLKQRGTTAHRIEHVRLLCEEADLVKFARHQPPVDESMRALERVAAFVRETARPRPAQPTADQAVLAALDAATRDAERSEVRR